MTTQSIPDSTAEQDSFAVTLIKAIPKTPYDELALYQQILDNRTALGGRLFVDLMAADIVTLPPQSSPAFPFDTWNTLYPPQNKPALIRLLQTIEAHTPPGTRAASLIYYLFLDYPPSLLPPDESLARYYAEVTDLPDAYVHLVQGLHALDSQNYAPGLAALAHPDIVPNYTEQIVAAFIRAQSAPPPAPAPGGYSLAIAYITAKAPQIATQPVIAAYVSVLCQTSLPAALDFIRCVDDVSPSQRLPPGPDGSHDPYDQISPKTALLKVMIDSVLVLKPAAAQPASTQSPAKRLFRAAPMAWRFANLPFSLEESRVVATILLNIITLEPQAANGAGQAHTDAPAKPLKNTLQRASLSKDILLLRALHTGDTELAVKVAALGKLPGTEVTKTTESYGELEFGDLARGVQIWDSSC